MAGQSSQRFGPYVILDRIGDGGMAEIFLAKMQGYSGFEKLIALKKIHPKYSQNETFAQMLIHEAKLAAALSHFNVVQVHDLGEIEGQVYIAMEYVRGRDMAAVLSNTYRRRERLPIELSLFCATEFMTGLEYAHRLRADDGAPLGIIHRDISPQNILISYEGEVKVTDFGIARVISEKTGFRLPGNLHGKFGYMSPEQAQNLDIDQRSDVFSAGVVLWEMLVGARLFRGGEQHETIKLVLEKEIPLPSELNPDVPASVDRICLKALARDREQRYQTMGALLGELSRAADSAPRRAGSRDLSVYMRRQFGTTGGGFSLGRASNRSERSSVSQHSGFVRSSGPIIAGEDSDGNPRVPIGQILLSQGAINLGELELALAEQRAQGGRIGEVLVSIAAIDDVELAEALATQANLPSISTSDLGSLPAPSELIARFPRHAAETGCLLPIAVDNDERAVRLAVCDPYDERAVLEAKVVLGVNDVALLVAPRSAIREALSRWYTQQDDDPLPIDQPIFESEALTEEVEPEPMGPPRVLIADADDEVIRLLHGRFSDEGWVVDLAADGRAARSLCREQPPAVAIFDASLPGIDGYNLLLEMRAGHRDAAVFITSERGDDFRQAKALELGADDFLVKPVSVEVLVSKVRRELSKRASGPVVSASVHAAGVSGSLEDMSVLDIAQSLELGRKTAHVVVQYEDGRHGFLRVDDGQLRGARTEALRGPDAFYQLAVPGHGRFRIEYRASSQDLNIDQPNTFLMVEAMRHLDEGSVPGELVVTEGKVEFPPVLSAVAPLNDASPMQDLPVPSSRRITSSFDVASTPGPLSPALADDLTLEPVVRETSQDLGATRDQAKTPDSEELEDWISEQLSGAGSGRSEPATESSDGLELARIKLGRRPSE